PVLTTLVAAVAKDAHPAGAQADAVNAAVLLAALHPRQHAHADAEEPAILADLAHQGVEAQATDLGHAVADGTDAGEHHAIRLADHLGVAGHQHSTGADMFEGLGHRVQVAHAVIDDGNGLHHRHPLVEGI